VIIGIVAIAENYAIGKEGKLPWHYSSDLKYFKETTTGNVVVMGARTWNSIGKPLPNRLNIVLSRSIDFDGSENVLSLREKSKVLALSSYLNCDIFIIGGAKTFEAFASNIEKWIVTRIPITVEDPDVSMPTDFLEGFKLEEIKDLGEGLKVEIFRSRPT
jgi:dihydrofolate reductase